MTDATNNVIIDDVDLYRKHVVYYFDTQMNHDILSLSGEDQNRMFQMFTDYADVLVKIFHKGIPILEHIAHDDQWKSAKENTHPGIDWEHDCEIVKQYKIWLFNKNK